jgi:hypothetical protein
MRRPLVISCLLAYLVFVAGCVQPQHAIEPLVVAQEEEVSICAEPEDSARQQAEKKEMEQQSLVQDGSDPPVLWGAGKDPALCYKLQPSVQTPGDKKKKAAKTVTCCQPQSLIYARCRSGIETCRLGDTSPVQWFSCAKKMGNTTNVPASGAILVLDGNGGRKMPTGHPLYVESARKNSNGTWLLRISHTNYDRRCSLDQDTGVLFDPAKMTVAFQSGPWSCWARDLKILGFIIR